jgi:hypothetical protein
MWIPTVIACPVCEADTGLRLAFKTAVDAVVEAACPVGHTWVEPRVDVSQWMAYCRFRAGQQEFDWLWLIQAGFGEEPPPPIDYVAELRKSSVEIAKYAKRKAKTKVRREVSKARKKVGKRVRNEAMRRSPRSCARPGRCRPEVSSRSTSAADGRSRRPRKPLRCPPTAYGMESPKKGPTCLICEDSGRITAPDISIPCTECAGPAATALTAAERRAGRARQGKDRRRTRTENRGVITRSGEQADGPAQAATGTGPGADKAQHAAAEAIARSIRAPAARVHTGVTNPAATRSSATTDAPRARTATNSTGTPAGVPNSVTPELPKSQRPRLRQERPVTPAGPT